jgi:ankyrin repeat protein
MSFQKGYFEIIKHLVSENSYININEDTKHEYPLHVAAYEGSYEVITLLLSKGVPIDTLNTQQKNCLDIAIDRDQRECIKVLLKDKNWSKLIEIESRDRSFSYINVSADEALANAINKLQPAVIENPQLNVSVLILYFILL